MNVTRATLNVSRLPANAMDHHSPIWWGNLLLLFIETTMFALLLGAYFYVRQNFADWPPPRIAGYQVELNPVPSLGIPTVNMILLLLSLVPSVWVDRACLRRHTGAVKIGLLMVIGFGLISIVLRFYEFPALKFKWNDNAYGSITWTLLGMHLAHLLTATVENAIMTAWIFAKGMDDK